MQRVSSWLIGLLALAVFAAAGYVITKKDPVPNAGQVLPVASGATRTDDSAGVTSSAGSAVPNGSASPSTSVAGRVIAFLGDDWTAGVGATAKAKRFTSLVAAQLGATEKNFGADGSGYAKATADSGAYSARIDTVVAAKPAVVVVAGGRNDVSDYLPTLRTQVRELFAELHKRLPDATLVAVSPLWGDSDPPAELAPVASAVKQYVTASGGMYVDLSDPVRGHPSFMKDGADPNDKGYAAIAAALTPQLRALLA